MDPFIGGSLIGLGGNLLGGLFGSLGQSTANAANKELQDRANQQNVVNAKTQMDFQERMANTAYQRSMADMRAAGLNPMLAFSQGGASSPGGSLAPAGAATAENTLGPMGEAISKSLSSAYQKKQLDKDLEQKDAQIDLTAIQAEAADSQIDVNEASAEKINTEKKALETTMPSLKAKNRYDTLTHSYNADMYKYDGITRRIGEALGIGSSASGIMETLGKIFGRGKEQKGPAPAIKPPSGSRELNYGKGKSGILLKKGLK